MPSRRALLASVGVGTAAATAVGLTRSVDHRPVAPDALESTPYDWPVSRYDAAGTGYNPAAVGPKTKPTVAWEADLPDRRPMTPILLGETLFVTGHDSVVAFDARTGERRFARGGSFRSSPARAETDVYRTDTLAVANADGLSGLSTSGGFGTEDVSFGFERWRALPSESDSLFDHGREAFDPVAVDDVVFVADATADRLVAVDANDGRVRWEYTSEDPFVSPAHRPVVRDGIVYLATSLRSVHAVDAASGELLWEWEQADPIWDLRPPTATGSGVVVPARGAVALVDEGEAIWTYEHGGNATGGAAAVADGTVVISDGDGHLLGLDLETGDSIWTTEYGPQVDPVVADDVVYVAYDWLPEVVAFDLETGEERWTVETIYSPAQPIVGDDVLYVAGHETVIALEER
ncbi:PQQ-binding-like beta-propeller repeat protein [Halovivax gelatinilyticus]|uniref:outer membrane protein assembly factor BamB family protein n=1 Tax=Halovivax gelatinilyticus TaxID=2961597 RepID=UPI0020CA77A8|nr:PQQ-binding-like beta-propeller repeat protein [Halovivax gelatinilyticus]